VCGGDLHARTPGIETISLYGERYLPIEEWASSRNFSYKWDKRRKTAEVKSRWSRLVFEIDSKQVSFNGVSVWLSSAIALYGGRPYITQGDVDKLIEAVLYPDKLPKGKKIKTIAIAAGHGGKDPGYQINRYQEKKYTLLMAASLKEALKAAGFKVIMTRDSDVFVGLEAQASKANRAGADVFITVHYNAAGEVNVKGLETYCLTPAGETSTNGGTPSRRSPGNSVDTLNALLAYHVHKSLITDLGLADRGLRRAGFLVLRNITMPGVYIEGGFLSNPSDKAKIVSAKHRKAAARAVVDGVIRFKRLVERK
jgi:N-acetylmuramoyl-L-alanine amidase